VRRRSAEARAVFGPVGGDVTTAAAAVDGPAPGSLLHRLDLVQGPHPLPVRRPDRYYDAHCPGRDSRSPLSLAEAQRSKKARERRGTLPRRLAASPPPRPPHRPSHDARQARGWSRLGRSALARFLAEQSVGRIAASPPRDRPRDLARPLAPRSLDVNERGSRDDAGRRGRPTRTRRLTGRPKLELVGARARPNGGRTRPGDDAEGGANRELGRAHERGAAGGRQGLEARHHVG